MRTLKWKGIEAIPDKLGFWTWYKDWKPMTSEEKKQLTWEQVCEVVSPQNEEEWRDYWKDKQAEWDYEEACLKDYIEDYEEPIPEEDVLDYEYN